MSLYDVVLSLFGLIAAIVLSLFTDKLNKPLIIIAALNFLIQAVSLYFGIYEILIENNLFWYYTIQFINLGLSSLFFLILIIYFISKKFEYKTLLKLIKDTDKNVYFAVNKNEKIKMISQNLLALTGNFKPNRKQTLTKFLSNYFRFIRINGNETSNVNLEEYYLNFKKYAKKGSLEHVELVFYNQEGSLLILKGVSEPNYLLNKYRGRAFMGEIVADFDLLQAEKETKLIKLELEGLQERMIAFFESSNNAVFSSDLDEGTIWFSDFASSSLSLSSSFLTLKEYQKLIDPKDLEIYLLTLSKLTPKNPTYNVIYKFNINGTYRFINESGKRVFCDGVNASIMGSIKVINPQKLSSFENDTTNSLKDEESLIAKMTTIIQSGVEFQIAYFYLKNIPDINNTFSYHIGNLTIVEYLTNLKKTFLSQNDEIYRITGIGFIILITDYVKFNILKEATKMNKDASVKYAFGSTVVNLDVRVGVYQYSKLDSDLTKALNSCKEALFIASNNESEKIVFKKGNL